MMLSNNSTSNNNRRVEKKTANVYVLISKNVYSSSFPFFLSVSTFVVDDPVRSFCFAVVVSAVVVDDDDVRALSSVVLGLAVFSRTTRFVVALTKRLPSRARSCVVAAFVIAQLVLS